MNEKDDLVDFTLYGFMWQDVLFVILNKLLREAQYDHQKNKINPHLICIFLKSDFKRFAFY